MKLDFKFIWDENKYEIDEEYAHGRMARDYQEIEEKYTIGGCCNVNAQKSD